jgi:hypothetical protein
MMMFLENVALKMLHHQAIQRMKRMLLIRELHGVGVDDEDENRRSSLDEAEGQATLNLRCLAEFKTYLDAAKASVSDKSKSKCPLQWWKENKSAFNLLAPVARKWLGCLAISALNGLFYLLEIL